jgi:hypothetical protein
MDLEHEKIRENRGKTKQRVIDAGAAAAASKIDDDRSHIGGTCCLDAWRDLIYLVNSMAHALA